MLSEKSEVSGFRYRRIQEPKFSPLGFLRSQAGLVHVATMARVGFYLSSFPGSKRGFLCRSSNKKNSSVESHCLVWNINVTKSITVVKGVASPGSHVHLSSLGQSQSF